MPFAGDVLHDILYHLGIDPYGSGPRGDETLKRGAFTSTFSIGTPDLFSPGGIIHWYRNIIRGYHGLLSPGAIPIWAESAIRMNLASMEGLCMNLESHMGLCNTTVPTNKKKIPRGYP